MRLLLVIAWRLTIDGVLYAVLRLVALQAVPPKGAIAIVARLKVIECFIEQLQHLR